MAMNTLNEQQVDSLIHNYMDRIFYFCLKNTSNSYEAENLASDILFNIVASLKRGNKPGNDEAWVWGITRNRYSAWAKINRNKNELFSQTDISEYEIVDNTSDIENEVVKQENLGLLRRELALVSKDYRDVVVAYYIEDRKLKDIATSLNLPEGTVKAKLFRARKILKEGMNMAREFGVRSYKPENVNFAASGSQPSGLPWTAVERSLPKNILLEADNNPLTLEQLAIELGIAMPYLEEEVNLLVNATLLKKVDNKYVTNIFIASSECQLEVYEAQREDSKKRSEILDTIVMDSLSKFRDLGIVRNNMSDEDLKWWAMIFAMDVFVKSVDKYNINFPEKRANGETWGFMGFETCTLPENVIMGHNGNGDGKNEFWAYKIGDYNLCERVGEMTGMQTLFLADVLKNKRNASDFSDSEMLIWQDIENRFVHKDEAGNIISDILVLENSADKKCEEILLAHPLAGKLLKMLGNVFDKTISILRKNSHTVLEQQLDYCATMMCLDVRMMMVHDEVEANRLIVPENPGKSTIAMWIVLE